MVINQKNNMYVVVACEGLMGLFLEQLQIVSLLRCCWRTNQEASKRTVRACSSFLSLQELVQLN